MSKAVVLLSGGLDSTTTLAKAIADGNEVTALSFNYGQRHSKELISAANVAKHYGIKHVIVNIDLSMFRSALTDRNIDVPENRDESQMGSDIPVTYVPSRNIIMMSVAAGLCESIDAEAIYIGANVIDYSGYPDCRPEFFYAFQKMLEVGTKTSSARSLEVSKSRGLYIYNIGTGHGYSVLDMVKAFIRVNGIDVPYSIKARRAGDIATCYCNPAKAKAELGWEAKYGIDDMVRDSWNWQRNNPDGF